MRLRILLPFKVYIMMKNTTILLLILLLSSSISTVKAISADQSTVPLSEIVKSMEKKFDVSITYDASISFTITQSESDKILNSKDINSALTLLVNGKDIKFKEIRSDYYVLAKKEEEPKATEGGSTKKIDGIVRDGYGESLPGATVVAVGNLSIHAISDIEGRFSIEIPSSVTMLEIKYLGFTTQTVSVVNVTNLEVRMQADVMGLKGVIVSGVAGKTPREKLTVTVEHLDAAELKKVPASSAASVLQGKVAGVVVTQASGQPGSGTSIRLRGVTSMLGNNEPLIIVDGIMIQTSLSDFNSDDIESIEVVKGPAASALYGSRAAGGVIVISTKRGKKMADSYEIVFRNEFGNSSLAKNIEQSNHHPYKLAADNADFPYTKYENVQYDADGNVVSGSRILTDSGYADQPYALIRDHQEEFFKSGNYYTNYIGVATKAKSSNLFFSFENHHNEGIIFNTDGYTRRNFRFNSDTRIGKKFKFSTSSLYITSESDKPGSSNSFFDLLFINPDVDLNQKNPDGSPYLILPDPWSIEENPLYPLYYRDRTTNKSTFMSSLKGSFKVNKCINIDATYSYEKFDKYYNTYTPKGYLYGGGASIGGSIYKENYSSKSQTFQTTANYINTFGDFLVKAKLSYLYEDQEYHDFSVTGRDFIVPGIPQLTNTDPTKSTLHSYDGAIRAINYFGIVDFDYKSKYLFSSLFRRDGSSLFGENERWQSYYRVAAAYRISEDIKIPGFQELKIRAAYGTSGLRPGFSWQYETYYFNNGQVYRDQLGNNNLKPSEARELEFAVDAQFLDRFTFTASYSINNTIGAFAKVPLASHLGYPYQWRNVGDIKSNVFEMSLSINAINSKDHNLSFRFNFDKITQVMENLSIPAYYTGPHSAYYINPGESFGIIYGYDWVKSLDVMADQLPVGKTIDDYEINSDGFVIEKGTQGSTKEKAILYDKDGDGIADKVAIGDGNADFHLNLSTTYSFKNFTFYMLLDWKQGGDVYNYTHQYTFRDARAIEFDQSGKAETEKKSVFYYSNFYEQSINSYFVENGTYLKLREFSAFYTYKPKNNNFIKSIKLGLIGRNLLTFTGYSGYDPEVASTGDLSTFAFDNFGYPNFRTISGSLQLTF